MIGTVLKRIFGLRSASTNLCEGIAAYDRGDLADATRLLGAALRAQPHNAEGQFYAGLTAYKAARFREALQHFERAIESNPANGECRSMAATTEYMLGNVDAAYRRCVEALERSPNLLLCHQLMSQITLPGPDYKEILSFIHRTLRPRTYVEIGVAKGNTVVLAQSETRVIGVDPNPKISFPLPANTIIHATTSDDYFAKHDVYAELGGLPIDLAFIDGMHQFEYALRDFINIEKHSKAQSIVLIHDCYPLNQQTAERMPTTTFWSGDIWRLILILKKYRPELRVHTIATPPTGLALVFGLDPASSVLERNLDDIVKEFIALDYSVLESDKPGMLNWFPNDLEKIRALLHRAGV